MNRLRRACLPLLAATLLLSGLAGNASAEDRTDPAGTRTADAQLSGGAAALAALADTDPAAALEEYWTPERMAGALPADNLVPDAADAADAAPAARAPEDSGGEPGSTEPAAPLQQEGGDVSAALTETPVVGRVFYTNPNNGGDYWCSAGALNSDSKQLLITAGHCVNVGGSNGNAGAWMTNWTYVPRYREGARPFGTFAAKQFRSFNGWINNSNFEWDVAMVTTWPLNGSKLVNVTGGHGLSWNYSRSQAVTIWGYPGNHASGQVQWWCQGTTVDSGGRLRLDCNFGGGSSGGPWLRVYNDSTGLGQVNGVTSTVDSAGANRSPYFGDSVKEMFDAQGSYT
ncbi:S1 family peptidase [Streptomyces sp. JH002]|uniref:trypsin-like serine peptidase n=1 Tax=Streptomyces sp. JH002 TaxID=2763259 RepID=UPI003D801E02